MDSLSVKEARNISSKGLFLRSDRGEAATGYIITNSDPYGTLTFTDPDNFFSIYDSIKDLKIKDPTFGQVIVHRADGWTNGEFYYYIGTDTDVGVEYHQSVNVLKMKEITIHGDCSFDIDKGKLI